MLDYLRSASALEAVLFFLAANGVIFITSILACRVLAVLFSGKRIFDRWEPLRAIEVLAALGTVMLNALVSVGGWYPWTQGLITLRSSGVARSALDCLLMILAMDLGMYFFHRIAHIPGLYPLAHRFHHRHKATNPISLFVLHPAEVIGFGGIMIGFLFLYPMSVAGLMGYLTLNVIFGTLGHSGVEPFPTRFGRLPIVRWIGTSTFHAEHHEDSRHNFDFYTLLWDRLFGTLDPDYDRRFRQVGREKESRTSLSNPR